MSKVSRSPRRPFCIPATRRLARIVCSKELSLSRATWRPGSASVASLKALPEKARERCGERLSTVNGPDTRTFLLSSCSLS